MTLDNDLIVEPNRGPRVWLVYEEISDQYGTSKVVGVFSDEAGALAAQDQIRDRRSYVKAWPINRLDRTSR